jgi:hypothetical protein
VTLALASSALVAVACAGADSIEMSREPQPESAAADSGSSAEFPSDAYYGDLHVHTALSADAYIQGARAGVDDAFRYAKGEPIPHVSGQPIQAKRALDFLALTDHAEYLGIGQRLFAADAGGDPAARSLPTGLSQSFARLAETIQSARPHPAWIDEALRTSAWQETIAAANRHDDPGRFTTLLGFEWTASPEGRNLHRNVILDPRGALPDLPFSIFDAPEPEALWAWMEAQRARGSRLLAIPHNSNLSDGAMFARVDSQGRPIDAAYAALRARNEPLVEITQIKGTSETHPDLSPADEYAGFEIWSSRIAVGGETPDVEAAGSYVRDALLRGIAMRATRGFDPFRFGVIGSSDSHSASSPVEEDNYSGKGVQDTSAAIRLQTTRIPDSVQAWSASGLAAVWARANTRAEIFAALERRETFATTGTRIALRFFGGWSYGAELSTDPEWIAQAYAGGVPMGGTLAPRPAAARAPTFLVFAQRDPEGARLDRVQLIKGWSDGRETREQVIDLAVAPKGGADSLSARWIDPTSTHEPRPSTTCARSRFRRRAGRATTPSASASRRSHGSRARSRSAPSARRSGSPRTRSVSFPPRRKPRGCP